MKKKILTVVGARPQFIKASAVSARIRDTDGVFEVMVHTGQHYDRNMSGIFFDELGISAPHYSLEVGSGTHGFQTAKMLERLEVVLQKEKPDWVVIYGDTNSTMAAAIAASKMHLPIAHVEAGLRSYNRKMPEEINRVVADHVATILFAPTEAAVANLIREGLDARNVFNVGDVMYDSVLMFGALADSTSKILSKLNIRPKRYVLSTIHRAENTDDMIRLREIFDALEDIARETDVIVPLHPRTKKMVSSLDSGSRFEKLHFIDPVGYLDMCALERNASLIVTDSGGVQKEAFFHKVPCVTLRNETEWVELVELGWNKLVPPGAGRDMPSEIRSMIGAEGRAAFPYGQGNAAKQIIENILSFQC